METEETTVEHVQKLAHQAENLRMQSVAVPLKDLQILLQICEAAIAQQNAAATGAVGTAKIVSDGFRGSTGELNGHRRSSATLPHPPLLSRSSQ